MLTMLSMFLSNILMWSFEDSSTGERNGLLQESRLLQKEDTADTDIHINAIMSLM